MYEEKKLNNINRNISELESLLKNNKSKKLKQELENTNTEKTLFNSINENNLLNEKRKRLEKNIKMKQNINKLQILNIENQPNKVEVLKNKLKFLNQYIKINNSTFTYNNIIKILTNKHDFLKNNNIESLKGIEKFVKTQIIVLDEIKKKIENIKIIKDKIKSIEESLKKKKQSIFSSIFTSNKKKLNIKLNEEQEKLKELTTSYHMTEENEKGIMNHIKEQIIEMIKIIKKDKITEDELKKSNISSTSIPFKEEKKINNQEEEIQNSTSDENEETALLKKKYIPSSYPISNEYNIITTKIREKRKELNKLTEQRNTIALNKSIWKSVPNSLFKKIKTIQNEIKRLEINKNILKESKKKI